MSGRSGARPEGPILSRSRGPVEGDNVECPKEWFGVTHREPWRNSKERDTLATMDRDPNGRLCRVGNGAGQSGGWLPMGPV